MSIDPLVDNAVNRVRKELITRTNSISASIAALPALIPPDITKELTLVAGEDLTANTPVKLDPDGKVRRASNILAQGDDLFKERNFYPILAFKTVANNKTVVIYSHRTDIRLLTYSIFDSKLNFLESGRINLPTLTGLVTSSIISAHKLAGSNNSVGLAYSLGTTGVRFFSISFNDTTNAITVNSGVTILVSAATHEFCITSDNSNRFILLAKTDSTSIRVATFSNVAAQLGSTQSISTTSGYSTGVAVVAYDSVSDACYGLVTTGSLQLRAVKLTWQTDAYKISGSVVLITGSIQDNNQPNRQAVIFDNKIITQVSDGTDHTHLVAINISGGTINATAQILSQVIPASSGFTTSFNNRLITLNNKLYVVDKRGNTLIEIVSSVGAISKQVAGRLRTNFSKRIVPVSSATVLASGFAAQHGTDVLFVDFTHIPISSSITGNYAENSLSIVKDINSLISQTTFETLGFIKLDVANNANALVELSRKFTGVIQNRTNTGKTIGSKDVDDTIVLSATQSLVPLASSNQDFIDICENNLNANASVGIRPNGKIYPLNEPEISFLTNHITGSGLSNNVFSCETLGGKIFSIQAISNFTSSAWFSYADKDGNVLASGDINTLISQIQFGVGSGAAVAFKKVPNKNLVGIVCKSSGSGNFRNFRLIELDEAALTIKNLGGDSANHSGEGPVSITFDTSRELFIVATKGSATENPRINTFNLLGVRVGTEQTLTGFNTGANGNNEFIHIEYDLSNDCAYVIATHNNSVNSPIACKLTYQTDAYKLSGSNVDITLTGLSNNFGSDHIVLASSVLVKNKLLFKRGSSGADRILGIDVTGGTISTTGIIFTLPTPNTLVSGSISGVFATANRAYFPVINTDASILGCLYEIDPDTNTVSLIRLNPSEFPNTSNPCLMIHKLNNDKFLVCYSQGAAAAPLGLQIKQGIYSLSNLVTHLDSKYIGKARNNYPAKALALLDLAGVLTNRDNVERSPAAIFKSEIVLNEFSSLQPKINTTNLKAKCFSGTGGSANADATTLNLQNSKGGIIDYLILGTASGSVYQLNSTKITKDGNPESFTSYGSAVSGQSTTSYQGNLNLIPIGEEFKNSITLKINLSGSSVPYSVIYREEE
jgi:hypothetical protein